MTSIGDERRAVIWKRAREKRNQTPLECSLVELVEWLECETPNFKLGKWARSLQRMSPEEIANEIWWLKEVYLDSVLSLATDIEFALEETDEAHDKVQEVFGHHLKA